MRQPYSSPQVEGIKADFFAFEPSQPFDFATCFQVLEHVDDVQRFAAKLMDISNRVLVSVPYMWPANSHRDHKHDLINLDTLAAWFGRSPDYHIVVQEPLNVRRTSRRVIAYYHRGEMPPLHELRAKIRQRLNRSSGQATITSGG